MYTQTDLPTSASASTSLYNTSRGNLTNLGYIGMSDVHGSAFNISNNYNTESYIFKNLNSTEQRGIYTWWIEYTNFSRANLSYVNLNFTHEQDLQSYYQGMDFGYLSIEGIPIFGLYPVGCEFTYGFNVHSNVTTIRIQMCRSPYTIQYSMTPPPRPTITSLQVVIFTVLQALRAQVAPVSNKYSQVGLAAALLDLAERSYGLKIGYNSTARYNGQTYNNLPLYAGLVNSVDINDLPSPLHPIANPSILHITYMVPIQSQSLLLSANTTNGIVFKNITVYPYIFYKAAVPSTYSQFSPASFLNLDFSIYNPDNFATTDNVFNDISNPVIPFSLYTGGGLLANFSTTPGYSELGEIPLNSTAQTTYNSVINEFPYQIKPKTLTTPNPLGNVVTYDERSGATSITTAAGITYPIVNPANELSDYNVIITTYPPNSIIYINSNFADVNAVLANCANFPNPIGGTCQGAMVINQVVTLQGNLFVFGTINIQGGGHLVLNGHSVITTSTINGGSSASIISGYSYTTVSLQRHGTVGVLNISDPAFITESPNGFIYVINYSQTTGWFHFSTTTSAVLYKMTYIPQGYFNYSIYQPNDWLATGAAALWTLQESNYFRGALFAQGRNLYILSAIQFTSSKVPTCLFRYCFGQSEQHLYRFLKNIPGLWVLQECKRAWEREGHEFTYAQLTAAAAEAKHLDTVLDLDEFVSPGNHPQRIKDYCLKNRPARARRYSVHHPRHLAQLGRSI